MKNLGGGQSNNRILWIDLLRLLMTWMVVSIHGKCIEAPDIISRQWFEFHIIDSMSRCAVPLFFIISGALVLNGDCSVKKSLKRACYIIRLIILQFALCTFVSYLFFDGSAGDVFGLSYIYTKYGLYTFDGGVFFWRLVGCYLMTPLVYEITRKPLIEKYYLGLGFVFSMIIPIICDSKAIPQIPIVSRVIEQLNRTDIYITAGAVYMFVLGHFLRNNVLLSKRVAVFQFIGFLVFYFVIYLCSNYYFDRKPVFWNAEYGYQNPLTVIYATSFFLMFKSLFENIQFCDMVCRFIRYFAGIMVYVFIVHGMIIHIFGPYIPHSFWSISPILEIAKDTTVYFLVSLVIAVILNMVINNIKVSCGHLYRSKPD